MWCDAGYQGVHKREENLGRGVEWQVAMRPGKRRKLEPESEEALAERNKASVRAKVEHPFLKVKRVFGYAKVRYRGLAKNTERLALLFGLGNLLTAEGQLTGCHGRSWPNLAGGHRKGRSKVATAPPERNERAAHLGKQPWRPEYFRETPPVTARKPLDALVQSIPRSLP